MRGFNYEYSPQKQYFYSYNDNVGSVSYDISEENEIDTSKYSLFELINNEKGSYLHYNQRVDILNSWLADFRKKQIPVERKISVSGCKPNSRIYTDSNKSKREAINFISNDYLNLSQHPKVIEAAKQALDKYGAGSGSAPLVMGTTDLHEQLEKETARIKGCEAALVQSSGYVTNLGVIRTLMQKNDLVIFDMFAHASLIDGANAEDINKVFFPHNDIRFLESLLKKAHHAYVNKLVVVEGVYSMDGDIAFLDEIVELAHKYDAWVLVDDAHGLGVLGENGHGTIEHYELEGKVDIVTGTYSKSVGSIGGFVAGKKDLIQYLKYNNRSYIFSTSSFTPSIAASLEALKIIETEKALRIKLFDNIEYLYNLLDKHNIKYLGSATPIVPILFDNDDDMFKIASYLEEEGVLVMPVVYPIVPKGKPRLRLSLSSNHSKEDISKLVTLLSSF